MLLVLWAVLVSLNLAMAVPLLAVTCPPTAGDGAVKIRDLDGDNVKDWRFDAKEGVNKRTETDEAGNRKELWCVDHGAGSFFVWIYIAADGEPGAGKNKFIGFCEFVGGCNVRTEEKALINGKRRWSKTKHVNSDVGEKDNKVSRRIYDFDSRSCRLSQSSVKRSDGSTVVDKKDADPPMEDGRAIRLPPFPGPDPPPLALAAVESEPQPDPAICDADSNGLIDRRDIQIILMSRGTTAANGDPQDADADGLITVNDARVCVLMCTKPLCAE